MLETEVRKVSIEQMKAARETANVAFVKFTDQYRLFSSHIFCFYEGEDGKYYDQRIRQILGQKIITYTAGNKKEVLKVWRRICNDPIYENVAKMFFVDNDVDSPIADSDENLYVTPCYSIENLYVNSETFGRVLNSEFGVSIAESDYKRCVLDFEQGLAEFCNEMVDFNTLVLMRRKVSESNSNLKLSDYKTNHLVSSTILQICISPKYNKIINDMKDKLEVDDEALSTVKQEVIAKGNYANNFRGKNQMDFFVSILNSLKALNQNGEYFSLKLFSVK